MKKYSVIYADPPWKHESGFRKRNWSNKYPVMKLQDIMDLPIPADENCILYLWTTAPKLSESLQVMEAWGFKYRTCMVWDKMMIGLGFWFRNQHEILLLGIKGHPQLPHTSKRISSVYREKRGEHSKKPAYIRNYITEVYPNESKIELFAREKTPGWDVWGNEVESDITL